MTAGWLWCTVLPARTFVSELGSYSSLKILNNENKNGLRAIYLPVLGGERHTCRCNGT